MAKQTNSAKQSKYSIEQLMAMRWGSASDAEAFLKKHHLDLDALNCSIGMAHDSGMCLTPRTKVADGANRHYVVRLARPEQLDYAKSWALYYSKSMLLPMEVVDVRDGSVVASYDGKRPGGPDALSTEPLPPSPKHTAVNGDGEAERPKTVRRQPRAERPTNGEKPTNGEAKGKRQVSYETMEKLASRKSGVTGEELTKLNAGVPQPWKSWLNQVAKRIGKTVAAEKIDKIITYRLT